MFIPGPGLQAWTLQEMEKGSIPYPALESVSVPLCCCVLCAGGDTPDG